MISMKLLNLARIIFFVFVVMFLLSCAGLKTRTDAQAEFDRGLSLFNIGKFEDAVPHFMKATELEPNFGIAYLYIGKSYLNLGRWREAVPSLRTAYRLSPEETRKEIENILIDLLLINLPRIKEDTKSQFEDLLEQK